MSTWLDTPLIVVAALAVISALITVGVWVGRVNSDRKNIKGISKWRGQVDSDRSNFGEFMREIRDDIKRIFDRLPERSVVSGSPLRLTEFGVRMSEHVNVSVWAANVAQEISGSMESLPDHRIDQRCAELVRNPPAGKISDWIEENMALLRFEFGTDQTNVLNVLQVVLRDAVFEKLKRGGGEQPS